jgi:hypothetical protein
VADNCECGNEPSGSIERREFIDYKPVSLSRRILLHGASKYVSKPYITQEYRTSKYKHNTVQYKVCSTVCRLPVRYYIVYNKDTVVLSTTGSRGAIYGGERQHHTPPVLLLVSIKYEAGFVSEPVWTLWSLFIKKQRGRGLFPRQESNPGSSRSQY